jgi:serine/threonine-protein kinase
VGRSADGDETIAEHDRGAAAASVEPLPLRARLGGRYQIVDCLGRGGMGAVYLAIDEVLGGKSVALKVVARALTEDAALDQLRREVVLAQQVTHRNVCRIYDLEQLDGRWVIKMECVSGETLFDRIARGPVAIDEVIGIARQIALGLAAAHDQGVVHRDLKPGNVMIEGATGRVVLMDFGIARGADDPGLEAAGTPAFMAPEQVQRGVVDARTDVYALGWVIVHMLHGRAGAPAADGETFTTSTQTTAALVPARRPGDAPPDPRAGRADVPDALAALVGEMLAVEPAERPADGKAVAARLAALAAPAVLAAAVAPPVAPPRRRWPWIGLALGGTAAAAAVPIGLLVAGRHEAPRYAEPWHAAIKEIEPAYDENIDTPTFSPDGTKIAYSSDRDRPGWLRARVHDLVTGEDRAITPLDVNALMIGWTQDGRSLMLTDIAQDMRTFRVPLDGAGGAPEPIDRGYAIACGAGLLLHQFSSPGCRSCPRFVWREPGADPARDREVVRLDSHAFVTSYRCDRAGARVVWSRAELGAPFYQPADLWLADVATGTTRALTTDRKRNSYPTFTPDGRSIVFTSARGGGPMNLWELPLGADGHPGEPMQLTFGNGNDVFADVSPDGTQVLFDVDLTSAPLFRYGVGDGAAPRARMTPSRVILIDPQTTPDGREVIAPDFAPLAPRIIAVSTTDGTVRALGPGAASTVTPDGAEAIIAAEGAPAKLTAVALRDPAAARRVVGELPGTVRKLRVGPDGAIHAMVVRGEVLEAWRLPPGGAAAVREADAPWCFIQPAPAGAWSLWMRCPPGAPVEGVLVAPGTVPAVDAPGLLMEGPLYSGGDFDAAGTTYFAYVQPDVIRIDLATGARTTVVSAPMYGMTIAPDGSAVYTTEPVAAARRNLITNFATRPRPRSPR